MSSATDSVKTWGQQSRSLTLFGDTLGDFEQNDFIKLTMGAPGPKLLRRVSEIIRQSTQLLGESREGEIGVVLQYGPQKGSPLFLDELASFLSNGYHDKVDSQNLLVTAGATHGVHLTASLLLKKGAIVFVEDPTYFIMIKILREDLGMNIVPVLTDSQGIDVEDLERQISEHYDAASSKVSERYPFWSMLYLVPTYNNPRGICVPPERCHKLIELARKYNILLFCDDVYNLLHYGSSPAPPSRLLAYDNPKDSDFKGHVISNGTFSKILAPGIRVGWIEASDRILRILQNSNLAWSGGAFNHYASQLVAMAMKSGLQQSYLEKLVVEYRARLKAVCNVLRQKLPPGVTFREPQGGYFIWLELPEGSDAHAVAKMADEKFKVKVFTGDMFSAQGGFQNCLRLSIAYYEEEKLTKGFEQICSVISDYIEQRK